MNNKTINQLFLDIQTLAYDIKVELKDLHDSKKEQLQDLISDIERVSIEWENKAQECWHDLADVESMDDIDWIKEKLY